MTAITRLDPLIFPLNGSRLIEASAGTGKTFTLALLYLRLILQHGQTQLYHRPLFPPEILVVTFTKAATNELRDKIRRRLVEAAAVLRYQYPDDQIDLLLLQLREELKQQAAESGCELSSYARRLDQAAAWMDESAISTIHAWCHRMLQEHAFMTGHAFNQTLEENQNDLLQQAIEDYWRIFCIPLPIEQLTLLKKHWTTLDNLRGKIKSLLPFIEQIPVELTPPNQLFNQSVIQHQQALAAIKDTWRDQGWIEQLATLFEDAYNRNLFNKNQLNRTNLSRVISALREWLKNTAQEWPDKLEIADKKNNKAWRYMSSAGVMEIWKYPDQAPVNHPACQALTQLSIQLAELPVVSSEALLVHALHWIKARIEHEQHQRAELGQNDLLIRLAAALQSENGSALAACIRQQFPIALVDEFQDTDPVQYRIFDAIYHINQCNSATGFFMIGDPKQAIYAFRGADIYTYLMARHATEGRHYTLNVNYRSSTPLIAVINALFGYAEQTLPHGAFRFCNPDDANNPLPFHTVEPSPAANNMALWIDQQPSPPLQIWQLDVTQVIKISHYKEQMAQATACTIAQLLIWGRQGRAQLLTEGGELTQRPVCASDIAILVNDRHEADQIRAALQHLGIASVYLSERSSVFDTAIAKQLLIILNAVAAPFEESLLRQALATPIFNLTLQDLERLNQDEWYWEAQVERFHTYHIIWQQRGILPLLYQLINDYALGVKLLTQTDGERQLTDLLHLGELLQTASQTLDGLHAVLRYFTTAMIDGDHSYNTAIEAQQLRLENDAQLVKVVTIHKAKGLEYPLVFLPFILAYRPHKATDIPLITHDAQYRMHVHLHSTEAILNQADQERLNEDVRKLYVAMTRAKVGLWLGVANIAELSQSALGYLLALNSNNLQEQLSTFQSHITFAPLPETDLPVRDFVLNDTLATARSVFMPPLPSWSIASYSSLKYSTIEQLDVPAATTAEQETAWEEQRVNVLGVHSDVALSQQPHTVASLHTLPRGSQVGTFLHGLLEWAAVQRTVTDTGQPLSGYAAAIAATSARHAMLTQRCALRGLNEWIEPLDHWLTTFLQHRWELFNLPESNGQIPQFSFADLSSNSIQIEMEFWLESCHVRVEMLDQLIQQVICTGQPRPSLVPRQLNGMLKGFIDLVFEYNGRYYIVDWKSNWLGADDSAYTETAMRDAVLHARYDLQYVLYLLALHRLLRLKRADYEYKRHIGGVIYVFLRGTTSVSQGLFMDRPSSQLITTLDHLFNNQPVASVPCV